MPETPEAELLSYAAARPDLVALAAIEHHLRRSVASSVDLYERRNAAAKRLAETGWKWFPLVCDKDELRSKECDDALWATISPYVRVLFDSVEHRDSFVEYFLCVSVFISEERGLSPRLDTSRPPYSYARGFSQSCNFSSPISRCSIIDSFAACDVSLLALPPGPREEPLPFDFFRPLPLACLSDSECPPLRPTCHEEFTIEGVQKEPVYTWSQFDRMWRMVPIGYLSDIVKKWQRQVVRVFLCVEREKSLCNVTRKGWQKPIAALDVQRQIWRNGCRDHLSDLPVNIVCVMASMLDERDLCELVTVSKRVSFACHRRLSRVGTATVSGSLLPLCPVPLPRVIHLPASYDVMDESVAGSGFFEGVESLRSICLPTHLVINTFVDGCANMLGRLRVAGEAVSIPDSVISLEVIQDTETDLGFLWGAIATSNVEYLSFVVIDAQSSCPRGPCPCPHVSALWHVFYCVTKMKRLRCVRVRGPFGGDLDSRHCREALDYCKGNRKFKRFVLPRSLEQFLIVPPASVERRVDFPLLSTVDLSCMKSFCVTCPHQFAATGLDHAQNLIDLWLPIFHSDISNLVDVARLIENSPLCLSRLKRLVVRVSNTKPRSENLKVLLSRLLLACVSLESLVVVEAVVVERENTLVDASFLASLPRRTLRSLDIMGPPLALEAFDAMEHSLSVDGQFPLLTHLSLPLHPRVVHVVSDDYLFLLLIQAIVRLCPSLYAFRTSVPKKYTTASVCGGSCPECRDAKDALRKLTRMYPWSSEYAIAGL